MNFEFFERFIDYSFACTLATDWELQDFFSLVQEASVVDGDLLSWVRRFLFLCICLLFMPFPFQLKQIIFLQTRVERQTCLVAVLENTLLLQRTCLTNLTENTFFFPFLGFVLKTGLVLSESV